MSRAATGHASASEAHVLARLMGCALQGLAPEELPGNVTWGRLFSLAASNNIVSLAWEAARRSETLPNDLRALWGRLAGECEVGQALFDAERPIVVSSLRGRGISCMVLKGPNIAARYPRPELRQTCDNDILYGFVEASAEGGYRLAGSSAPERTASREHARDVVMDVMGELGYEHGLAREDGCDTPFSKPPMLNFEMHHSLIEEGEQGGEYFADPWRLARPTCEAPGREGCEFALSPEDEYVYLMAHTQKHLSCAGIGIRVLADVWVFWRGTGEKPDRRIVRERLARLGLTGLAKSLEGLSDAALSGDELTSEQERWLVYLTSSGAYGTAEQAMGNYLERARRESVMFPRLAFLARALSPEAGTPSAELAELAGNPRLRWLYPFARVGFFAKKIARDPSGQAARIRALLFSSSEEA